MLSELYSNFEKSAKRIKNWNKYTKSQLANMYCDARDNKNKYLMDSSYSALVCKYWYMVPYMYNQSKSTKLDIEDFVGWLCESLDVAFKYSRWRDINNPLSKDPKAPEKVINRCIFSTRQRWYAYFNKDKRKSNFISYSIEDSYEEFGDSAEGIEIYDNHDTSCIEIIDYLIKNGKIIEALIVDGICFHDTIKEVKSSELKNLNIPQYMLSEKKLIKHLNNLDDKFFKYFINTYNIDKRQLKNIMLKVNKLPNKKLYNYVNETLSNLKNDEEVIDLLCC